MSPEAWHLRGVWAWVWGVVVAASVALCAWVYVTVHRWQAGDEAAQVASRMDGLAAGLSMELARFEALPEVIALDPRLVLALTRPGAQDVIGGVNQYLRRTGQHSGADAVYLMDTTGKTLASSNFDTKGSFVGQNYGFRPYVKDALQGKRGRFYAVGVTTGKAGYFLAAPVKNGGEILGVLAVKTSLERFESSLEAGGGTTILLDSAGVALLASDPALRYRTLRPLLPATAAEIEASRQFGGRPLMPLAQQFDLERGSLERGSAIDLLVSRYTLVVSRPLGVLGWRLVAFSEAPAARRMAILAATVCALACIGLTQGYLSLKLRRERRGELLAREGEIHRRIASATKHLHEQLEEQARIEVTLRATTDSAVQAGKLAILGQMAAAISHELNQPLTAMRGFAANAMVLVEQGQTDRVQRNLGRIDELADKMGQMVGQLRSHVRKQPGPVVPVLVSEVFDSARELLQTLMKGEAELTIAIDAPGLLALAQRTRLEQVMVNLMRNAIEAVPRSRPPCVSAKPDGPFVMIEVRDFGPGLSTDVLPRLFEPFFTTKGPGQGLGLGLALSRMIVRELGGELFAGNAAGGGAVFRIRLPGILTKPTGSAGCASGAPAPDSVGAERSASCWTAVGASLPASEVRLAEKIRWCVGDRGRDAGCPAPPAQIRTCPIRAYGSYLGCLTAKRSSGQG